MKRITIFIFLMILIGHINAQFLVIDHPSSGGNSIPFQDTLLTSYDPVWGSGITVNYYIDLDQDTIWDIQFYLVSYIGGMGSYYIMSVNSLNDFSIHIDTSYVENYQFIDSTGQVRDTSRITPVVRKYNRGDTIYNKQNNLATEEEFLDWSYGNYPPCVYSNINLFLGDTSYIAFEKSNLDLYYLKIYVPTRSVLELMNAKTNAQNPGIHENELLTHYIYPNPAMEEINFKKSCDLIRIYTMQGNLIFERKLSKTQKNIDVSYLKSGLYIVDFTMDRKRHTTKLLKR